MRHVVPFLLLLALGACRHAPPAADPALTVVLIRHAEKADDGTRDPDLTAAGRARATAYAERYGARLVAAFATEYRRTQQTAAPAAAVRGIDVEVEPFGSDGLGAFADRLAARVRALPHTPGGVVLVVGHSNTTPAVAEALLGRPVAPIAEDEYDRVIEIRLGPGGAVLPDR